MKFYVSPTSADWFNNLRKLNPDEANFWKPSGRAFHAVEVGAPFLFRLEKTNNIVGGGTFVQSIHLPAAIAWDIFGEKNGFATFEDFHRIIDDFRKWQHSSAPHITCIILSEPFFLERENWLPEPTDWKTSLAQGKSYSTDEPIGNQVWESVKVYFESPSVEIENRYREILVRQRLGQGAFRVLVTVAYNKRCAMTGEKTLPALVAGHIKPYALSGPHRIQNGILLRADLHMLFDQGYITITEDFRVEVSSKIKEDYENGREYYAIHGANLSLPQQQDEIPSLEYVRWHNQNVYLK